jgi:hypothetical protein
MLRLEIQAGIGWVFYALNKLHPKTSMLYGLNSLDHGSFDFTTIDPFVG